MAHIPRVHCPTAFVAGDTLSLDSERAHHLRTVLRRGIGDTLRLWNGQGEECDATLEAISSNRASVKLGVIDRRWNESPLRLQLAQGLARGDRFERALTQAIELGVHAVQPLWCQFSQGRLQGPRLDKKQAAWRKQALAAAEQSERSQLPKVHATQNLDQWLAQHPTGLVLHPDGQPLADIEIPSTNHEGVYSILVGPEGGLSDAEVSQARAAGLQCCRIGPRILRTEHAGAAVIAILQARFGDL